MRKIGEIQSRIKFIIKFDDNDTQTPYRLYQRWWEGGYHEKLCGKYRDLYACILAIEDRILRGA